MDTTITITQSTPHSAYVIELLYSSQMPPYKYNGPISCDVDFDTSGLEGKTAIVTGGMLSNHETLTIL